MQRTIVWLAAVLALQIVITAGLALTGERFGTRAGQAALLGFDPDAVRQIEIRDGNGNTAVLTRSDGRWILPGRDGFPAARKRVEALLAELSGLRPGLAVTTSAEGARRFRTGEEAFEYRLTLTGEGEAELARLHVGDSPGYGRSYVRAGGEAAVFEVALDRSRLIAEAERWEDRQLLHRNVEDVKRIETGALVLERGADGWRIEGLGGDRTTDQEAVREAVGRLASLDVDTVAGPGPDAPAQADADARVLKVELGGGQSVEYRFVPQAEGNYLLTVSDQPWRFRLTGQQAGVLEAFARDRLTAPREAETDPAEATPTDPA